MIEIKTIQLTTVDLILIEECINKCHEEKIKYILDTSLDSTGDIINETSNYIILKVKIGELKKISRELEQNK